MWSARPFEKENVGAKNKILFLGDSTAVGVGADDPRDSIAGRFAADFPDAHIINLGRNGQRVGDLAREFEPGRHGQFSLVVIQIGGNDILQFTSFSAVARNIATVLEKARRVSDKVILLHTGNVGLVPFIPRHLGPLFTHRTRVVRRIFMAAAKKYGSLYVDLFKERSRNVFKNFAKKVRVRKLYAVDLLHPNGAGYGVWYRKLRETMHRAGLVL